MASPNMVEIRKKVKSVYPGEKWAKRVNCMGDNQVFALYISFMRCGRLKE